MAGRSRVYGIGIVRVNQIKAFILEYHVEHKNSPSLREIAQAIGISTTVTHYYLKRLEAEGWLMPRPERVSRYYIPVQMMEKNYAATPDQ